ncbi:DUF1217 domain-containing protein [Frigidibacter sp. MR17.24]|uniref:DUF1217 domain-containing protein n=1 Tax=Frigidibacter sp. MR17.24 TaxID=3127345 RepID=UPI0030129D27
MVSLTAGLTGSVAYSLIERTRDKQLEITANQGLAKREIAAFRENAASITSVDDLMENYEVYSFVMKAYDLEDQIFGKAMMKKILSQDSSDEDALVNKLTDTRFKTIYEGLDFASGTEETFQNADWVEELVAQYTNQVFINSESEENESVGAALEFKEKASTLTSWYKVLADETMSGFIRTALGLPDSLSTADVDMQAKLFAKKMDIEDLQDPEVQEKLIRTYLAISDAQTASDNLSSNPIIQLMTSSSSGTFVPVTIDIEAVQGFSASRYR